ncbi:HNH endonuclease [Burkholderia ambifaria]|uniref:HNH endonuclease n=1 Tax=Burkholderia ambifaria TaxID=152480 RepID=UPI003C7E1823
MLVFSPMAITPEGALKIAAKKAGLDLDEYLSLRAAGLKRCTGCKQWRPISTFNIDASRYDGLAARGRCCTRVKVRVSTKGRVSTFKGRTHSAETKARISAVHKGKPSEKRGSKRTVEERAKISAAVRKVALRGPDCPAYRDGKSAERLGERFTDKYKQWRFDVMLRDRFTCQHCGDSRGGNLHAHHIKPFATHPELRVDLGNGITLCEQCHKAVHAKR